MLILPYLSPHERYRLTLTSCPRKVLLLAIFAISEIFVNDAACSISSSLDTRGALSRNPWRCTVSSNISRGTSKQTMCLMSQLNADALVVNTNNLQDQRVFYSAETPIHTCGWSGGIVGAHCETLYLSSMANSPFLFFSWCHDFDNQGALMGTPKVDSFHFRQYCYSLPPHNTSSKKHNYRTLMSPSTTVRLFGSILLGLKPRPRGPLAQNPVAFRPLLWETCSIQRSSTPL